MLEERTERLINRKLDGELTEAESLELDKRLIRSPEARALLAERQRLDALAAESLQMALAGPERGPAWSGDLGTQPPCRRTARRYLRTSIVAAAVIVLAMLTVTLPTVLRPDKSPQTKMTIAQHNHDPLQQADQLAASQGPVIPLARADSTNDSERRRTQVLGVYDDETQSLYLLEMHPRHKPDPIVFVDY